jgi:hypothetical protein
MSRCTERPHRIKGQTGEPGRSVARVRHRCLGDTAVHAVERTFPWGRSERASNARPTAWEAQRPQRRPDLQRCTSPGSETAKGTCSLNDLQPRAGAHSPFASSSVAGALSVVMPMLGCSQIRWTPDPPGAPDDLIACQQPPGHGPARLYSGRDPRRAGR